MTHPAFANHVDACRQHVCHRLWERYGLAFNAADVKQLEDQIVGGHADWVADQPGKSIYRLTIKRPDRDHVLIAVFSVRLWVLVTVLPCEAWIGKAKPCKKKQPRWSRQSSARKR